jgi:hypothetical protein
MEKKLPKRLTSSNRDTRYPVWKFLKKESGYLSIRSIRWMRMVIEKKFYRVNPIGEEDINLRNGDFFHDESLRKKIIFIIR